MAMDLPHNMIAVRFERLTIIVQFRQITNGYYHVSSASHAFHSIIGLSEYVVCITKEPGPVDPTALNDRRTIRRSRLIYNIALTIREQLNAAAK